MRKEAERWLRQAEADLKAAKDSFKDENYEWCCFQSINKIIFPHDILMD